MLILNQTPSDKITDSTGQPYFVWDQRITLEEVEDGLRNPDPDVRVRFLGRLMRDARPDDVFLFVDADQIAFDWQKVAPFLGRKREFWTWLLGVWGYLPEPDAR
ncbi:MAG: hypothetical protein ACJAYU_000450 [Bradymonadia bacterium]|jgi:hypothetical protein